MKINKTITVETTACDICQSTREVKKCELCEETEACEKHRTWILIRKKFPPTEPTFKGIVCAKCSEKSLDSITLVGGLKEKPVPKITMPIPFPSTPDIRRKTFYHSKPFIVPEEVVK